MVFHNSTRAAFHCQDAGHFQDHVFGRGPTREGACQLHTDHLKQRARQLQALCTTYYVPVSSQGTGLVVPLLTNENLAWLSHLGPTVPHAPQQPPF